ncbi:MAG: hypothetical protein R3A46_16385 [Thermomicrobiales bacterium]
MGNLGLGVILVGVFLIGFFYTWSLRHAFNLMVWFGVGWMGSLFVFYVLEQAGYGVVSTDPLGSAGAVAIGVAALVAYVYHRRWKKAEAERQRIKAEEAAARRARGEREPTFIGNVARAISKVRSSDR